MTWRVLHGDARDQLATLPERCVQTCVTSPPYYSLRDYGHDGQIGLEGTVDEYVTALVDVFQAVRRVLRDDGTVLLNLGDSYASQGGPEPAQTKWQIEGAHDGQNGGLSRVVPHGLKPKDLIGVPWRVAFALQADGWYLRSEIIWAKPNPMPESVTDRPTRAHEQVFMLAKQPRYFWDADAIREPHAPESVEHHARYGDRPTLAPKHDGTHYRMDTQAQVGLHPAGRNKRSVWTVATTPYAGAHFATFPPKLIEPCILAGSPEGATVLDPFAGSGTTGVVALRHNRSFVGVELNAEYVELARRRICDDAPLFNTGLEVAA